MVNTRRQNEKADTNPSNPIFSKEQNDLLIQKVHKYSLHATGEKLNLFVPGLNESSAADDMEKAYRSMSLRFYPDKSIHEDASKIMGMINKAKEGLKTHTSL